MPDNCGILPNIISDLFEGIKMSDRTIVITGTSSLTVETDYVRIQFDIDKRDLLYEKTLLMLSEQISKIVEVIQRNGFSKGDLKTSDFNIEKDSKYDKKKDAYYFVGYRARETLSLSFPIDNKKINSILANIWTEVKDAEFNISFYCHNPTKYENELIKIAVEDAREKAVLITETIGVKLKQIERIDYSFSEIRIDDILKYDFPLSVCGQETAIGSLPDMEPEDTVLKKTITIVWRIE